MVVRACRPVTSAARTASRPPSTCKILDVLLLQRVREDAGRALQEFQDLVPLFLLDVGPQKWDPVLAVKKSVVVPTGLLPEPWLFGYATRLGQEGKLFSAPG